MRKRAQNRTRFSEADCVCMTTKAFFCRGGRKIYWGIWPHFYPTQLTLFIDSDTRTHPRWKSWGKVGKLGCLFPSSRPPMYDHSVERWFALTHLDVCVEFPLFFTASKVRRQPWQLASYMSMSGESQLQMDPVEFEKQPVEVQNLSNITDRYRGI